MYSEAAVAKELPGQERKLTMRPLKPLSAGTSGFRGKTGIDVTLDHARVIGYRYGQWLRARHHLVDQIHVTVGHDQRHDATELADAVCSILLLSGIHVVNVGMVSTGLFTFAMKQMRQHGGILVTGSHMPSDRVGIIPMNRDGTYCTSDVTDFIEEGFNPYETIVGAAPFPGGHLQIANMGHLEDAYCQYLIRSVDADAIRAAHFKIVFDAGNGTMGPLAMDVLEMLEVDVSGIFIQPAEQPQRGSECIPENCTRAVVMTTSPDPDTTMPNHSKPFDLGIAVDGDGDRGMFISRTRGALDGDIVAGIFARLLLESGDTCVTPVSTGALLNYVAREVGATVELCRVGQPATGAATIEHNAKLYCEPASQKFGFTDFSLGYDALYTLLKMLEIMATRGKSLDQLVDEMPMYHRFEQKLPLEGFHAQDHGVFALARAREHFKEKAATICEIDGLRFDFEDGSWLLLRPSGTEPYFRIYVSGPDRVRARSLMEHARRNVGISLGMEKP